MIGPDTDASTVDLVREAIDEARELIKLEVALARNDIEAELTRARAAAIAFAVAAFASNLGLAMVLLAVAVASHAEVVFAGSAAFALFAIAAVAGSAGYRKTSMTFLRRTRERIGEDVRKLEESAHGA
jgi:hypothetical protein